MKYRLIASAFACLPFAPVQAALPPAVSAMLDDAIANGDEAGVEAIAKYARKANPDDVGEIDAKLSVFQARLAEATAVQAQAEAVKAQAEAVLVEASAAKAKDETVLAKAETDTASTAGFFDDWHGKGELGGFYSRNNQSTTGVSAGLKLTKEGENWRQNFRARGDYQRTNGLTSRKQFEIAFEPNYKFSERLYAFGLAQYESDRFQGFDTRYTLSGGMGYRFVDTEKLKIEIQGGPAIRQTDFVTDGPEFSLAGMGGSNLAWQISPTIKFTQNGSLFLESVNSTITSMSAIDVKISDSFSARLSYKYDREYNQALDIKRVAQLSRIALIYGF